LQGPKGSNGTPGNKGEAGNSGQPGDKGNTGKVIIEKSCGRRFLWKISEIWAGFGPVGNTEKEIGADYQQLLRAVFFSCFHGQKKV
jgi:hypothetical protein